MLLDSGILTICDLENTAGNGAMPAGKLVKKESFFFGERTVGINRAYLAMGADSRIDMLVRIHDEGVRPKIGQYALLENYHGQENADGDQYRITLVQAILDDDGLRAYDLTLERMASNYDVAQ